MAIPTPASTSDAKAREKGVAERSRCDYCCAVSGADGNSTLKSCRVTRIDPDNRALAGEHVAGADSPHTVVSTPGSGNETFPSRGQRNTRAESLLSKRSTPIDVGPGEMAETDAKLAPLMLGRAPKCRLRARRGALRIRHIRGRGIPDSDRALVPLCPGLQSCDFQVSDRREDSVASASYRPPRAAAAAGRPRGVSPTLLTCRGAVR